MKQGDKVVFSSGREKGVILSIRANGLVEVEMEIGMKVIVNKSEIAIDYSTPELHLKPIKTNRFYLDKTQPKKTKNKSKEVDLHISTQKIINLESTKVLNTQLDILSNTLNQAILEGCKELIIIHGIGEGILKKEVHNILRNNTKVKSFAEADNRKYGKGATKVLL
jgi:dsDNA-specific endonuclease/ATPase MutS2